MRDYEQMELDITLESDRSIKDNLQEVARFDLGKMIQEKNPETVRNRHEGYGIVAEMYSALQRNEKAVGIEMRSMLSILPNGEGDFMNICGSLYNAAIDVAVSAIHLAAQSRRIMEDLYDSEPVTPLEEYADSLQEDDGFEEAEESGEEAETLDETGETGDETETESEGE